MSLSDERLAAMLDSLRIGIVAVDAKGRVELQNAEASRILGVSADATRGRSLAEVLSAQHPAAALLMQVIQTRDDVSSNACAVPQRIGGDPLTVDLAASPIGSDDTGDEDPGAVLTLHDRTIGRELEDLVEQRARSELYAQLAAGIAHEIRNPLGGIRGAAELLEGRLEDRSLKRYSTLIRDETDRIRGLLDDLAELTRGGDLHPRPVNLHRLLDEMLALQTQSEGWREIDVRREYDPSIPELELDPNRMTQVFLTLARNAAQALEGRGRLVVRTRVESIYHVASEEGEPVRWVRIEIEDDGPGIPEEDLPHVFTPFFTRRDRGTGLGLPIAQHWVVRHGGRIQVAPAHAGGTRVRVLLPIRSRPWPDS